VSREILQQDERVTSIRNAVTKRVLTMLGDMAKKKPEQYQEFWDEFGEVLKEGAGEDFANRESLTKLLRFASTKSDDGAKKSVSLDQYLARKVEDQESIYYLCAETYETASRSPHLEIFKERGVEVVILFDRIDEWLMSMLTDYEGTPFVDVMRGDVTLPGEANADDDKDSDDVNKDDEHPLVERIKPILDDKVAGVRPSKRLTGSPACLVLSEDAMGIQMRRIMEANGRAMPASKPYFEFNPDHPLVQRLDNEADEDRFGELVEVLFDQASLAEGGSLQDPATYVERLNRLLLDLL
jgi:molecular chaperone HtpG